MDSWSLTPHDLYDRLLPESSLQINRLIIAINYKGRIVMSNDRQNVTEKIFKQVQKVIQHFCKKVGGEWHYLNTELPYIPMFENIVLITMAQVIRKEKVNFDD